MRWVVLCACLTVPGMVDAADPVAKSADILRLGWLEGHWSGMSGAVFNEEFWSSAAGGGLVGMHKDTRDGRMTSFEFFRIAADEQGRVCYFASPGGAVPTPFCAIELTERRVVFENAAHDFPQRVLYWIDDQNRLHARIEGIVAGAERSKEWTWTRSKAWAPTAPGKATK